ncbi:MAG: hypothetical protein IH925_08005 [Proteobacteria bacterium]|nr:hypothetical protein [Pseudomonadota bacterium]
MEKPTRGEIPEYGPGRFGAQGGRRETRTGKEAADNPEAKGAGGAGVPPYGGEGSGGSSRFERLVNKACEGTDGKALEAAAANAYPLPATVEQAWAEYRFIEDKAMVIDERNPGATLGPAMVARRRVIERLLLSELPAAGFADLKCRLMFLRQRHEIDISYDPEANAPLIDALLSDLDRLAAKASEGGSPPLRRSNADKRRDVMGFLRDPERRQWSNREIASQAGVSPQTVSNLRKRLSDKTGQSFSTRRMVFRNGKFFAMSTAKIGQSGKPGPVRPSPPIPARHGPQAAPGAGVEGIRPFQGASVKRPLREQLNEQLKRRLKEYHAERERLVPRP